MTWVSNAYSTGEASAFSSDAPLVLAKNHFKDTTNAVPIWSNGTGILTDPDRTASGFPTYNAYDGLGFPGTYGTGSSSVDWWYTADLNSVELNSIFISFALGVPSALNTVEVQLGSTSTYTATASILLAAGAPYWAPGSRIRIWSRANFFYTTVRWIRVRFTFAAASTISPTIGEIYVGRNRQLSRQWNYGGDEAPYGGLSDNFVGRTRHVIQYERAHGFRDFEFEASPAGVDQFGLDDVASFRTIATDSRGHTSPVVFVQHPFTTTTSVSGSRIGNQAWFGHIEPGIFMPKIGPFERNHKFIFAETQPFRELET